MAMAITFQTIQAIPKTSSRGIFGTFKAFGTISKPMDPRARWPERPDSYVPLKLSNFLIRLDFNSWLDNNLGGHCLWRDLPKVLLRQKRVLVGVTQHIPLPGTHEQPYKWSTLSQWAFHVAMWDGTIFVRDLTSAEMTPVDRPLVLCTNGVVFTVADIHAIFGLDFNQPVELAVPLEAPPVSWRAIAGEIERSDGQDISDIRHPGLINHRPKDSDDLSEFVFTASNGKKRPFMHQPASEFTSATTTFVSDVAPMKRKKSSQQTRRRPRQSQHLSSALGCSAQEGTKDPVPQERPSPSFQFLHPNPPSYRDNRTTNRLRRRLDVAALETGYAPSSSALPPKPSNSIGSVDVMMLSMDYNLIEDVNFYLPISDAFEAYWSAPLHGDNIAQSVWVSPALGSNRPTLKAESKGFAAWIRHQARWKGRHGEILPYVQAYTEYRQFILSSA
ncbi:hypothetical protein DACRYDRAFT_112050 [Dacryopinax primogenitus]|uniref:Uncharacterized protein n=1 Tax=Dacryopinax primogenitus (strain DJM 731) TaxID=1858805 RepID=M5FPH9_DACPD|nr:uncharacterized protein DACRYDRAFT_112050 [Dacryopinax primogenitus]EJT97088.1 hypothetical protein DACRYDRAFT_112050 [Dacryopinax primogenitus]